MLPLCEYLTLGRGVGFEKAVDAGNGHCRTGPSQFSLKKMPIRLKKKPSPGQPERGYTKIRVKSKLSGCLQPEIDRLFHIGHIGFNQGFADLGKLKLPFQPTQIAVF